MRDRISWHHPASRWVAVASVLAATVCAVPGAGAAPAASTISDIGVTFNVENSNNSSVACSVDGQHYRISGHLVGPASALTPRGKRTATLYLHPSSLTGDAFRFTAVRGYNYAAEMAARGQVSVVIDQLGYGRSAHPYGGIICIGGQASIAHQIIQQLHAGAYARADGRAPVQFRKVALAASSRGAMTAEVEAYTYDDVDALLPMSFADGPINPVVLAKVTATSARSCELAAGDGYGPGGYFFFWSSRHDEALDVLSDAEPAVAKAFESSIVRDACGVATSIVLAGVSDIRSLGSIDAPVLVVMGDKDKIFPAPSGETQRARYTGSHDATLLTVHNAGNLLMLERSRGELVKGVAAWLASHGF